MLADWLVTYLDTNGIRLIDGSYPDIANVGLLDTCMPHTVSFLGGGRFLAQLNDATNVSAVITTSSLSDHVPEGVGVIVCDDPAYEFSRLFNFYHQAKRGRNFSRIHPTARIHPSAVITEENVVIGENVSIGAGAIILEDVTIGNNSEIREGTIVGCSNTEMKMTKSGVVDVYHNKNVIIGNNVIIGANCTIDKGIYDRDTIIGDWARVGGNTLIGHAAHIGEKSSVFCCTICGSATVLRGARVNPGAIVSNKITIGEQATVSVGAVVVSDVSDGAWVTGNFAVSHKRFLQRYIRTMGTLDSED